MIIINRSFSRCNLWIYYFFNSAVLANSKMDYWKKIYIHTPFWQITIDHHWLKYLQTVLHTGLKMRSILQERNRPLQCLGFHLGCMGFASKSILQAIPWTAKKLIKINKILKCKIVFGNSRVNTIVNAIRITKYGYMIKKTLNSTELKLKLTL